jgi:hypothetical protein
LKKVKNVSDLFNRLEGDIVSALDTATVNIGSYTEDTIYEEYTMGCKPFWPIKGPDGQPMIDIETGEPYTDDYRPEKLAYMLKSDIDLAHEHKRIVRVWVDTEGKKNASKFVRVGRLLETFGCAPWKKLKMRFMSATEISKAVTSKRRIIK